MELSHENIVLYCYSNILINGDIYGPNITLYGKKLENVKTLKYLGAILTEY